jgi:hypothetical protein
VQKQAVYARFCTQTAKSATKVQKWASVAGAAAAPGPWLPGRAAVAWPLTTRSGLYLRFLNLTEQ